MSPVEVQEATSEHISNHSKAANAAVDERRVGKKMLWIAGCVFAGTVSALALWMTHSACSQAFIGFPIWQMIAIVEILFLAGVMSGLSGFGFSAIGSSCLLFMSPKLGVPLLMALSTANQFMSLSQLRKDMPKTWKDAWPNGTVPYVLGGVIGVPLGIWLLNHLPAEKLMLVFGAFLTLYAIYSLLKPAGAKVKVAGGAGSGMTVGFIGGTVGGFTAFPGAAVVVWTGLRDLPKQVTRSIVQPYILVLQVMSLVATACVYSSTFGSRFWMLLAVTMPIVLPGTISGVLLYRRISDLNFKRVSFILLGISGVGLLVKVLF
jgi:uncharacterized membrane protein YfcA